MDRMKMYTEQLKAVNEAEVYKRPVKVSALGGQKFHAIVDSKGMIVAAGMSEKEAKKKVGFNQKVRELPGAKVGQMVKEDVELDENIVSDKLYRASHGKKPNPNETGGWYFGFSTHSDDIVYQSPNKMKYKDAKKEAEKVAKEKGHKKIYVMASYDPTLDESRSDFDVDASPMIRKYIEQGKGIVASANSTLGGKAKFVVMKRPTSMGRAGQDQFMMATISDPSRGRIKMFAYHGTHPSKDGAMKMGKSRKLAESVKLEEKKDPRMSIVSKKISKLKDKERDLLASAINMSGGSAGAPMANRANLDRFNDGVIIPAMTFLRKNMSSLTPEGKKLGKTILKVLGEAVELDEMKLTPKKMAFSLGQKAHMSGKRREPIKDNRLKALLKTVDDSKTRNAMNKEWLRGWDQQNLKDDVQEAMADRKVVSTPSLGSMNAPSSNFRMNLPPTGKMKKQMQQIMKKDASYRRKMSNLVQKSETQKDGTITLHFSSARKRTSFQKLLHQGIKEGLCEAVDKDDTKFAKKLVKNLRKGSKTHAKQADDLEKAINDERDYKKEYQNYHSKPEQRANRSKRVLARREMIKSGRASKGDGKDVDHKDGNPQNNSPSNLRMMSVAKNRSRNNNNKEEYGAGEEGTDKLVDKYRRETPGQ